MMRLYNTALTTRKCALKLDGLYICITTFKKYTEVEPVTKNAADVV